MGTKHIFPVSTVAWAFLVSIGFISFIVQVSFTKALQLEMAAKVSMERKAADTKYYYLIKESESSTAEYLRSFNFNNSSNINNIFTSLNSFENNINFDSLNRETEMTIIPSNYWNDNSNNLLDNDGNFNINSSFITEIHDFAFKNASFNGDIILPNVISVGQGAFESATINGNIDLSNVSSIPLGYGATIGIFENATINGNLYLPNVSSIANRGLHYLTIKHHLLSAEKV